ncbi:MAG: iron ABC transporter permease [Sedimentibacter sp.]|uniref:ABC transporter permease n=1 Tax=Sedimentibacter sp. TaxID=1960295 RepID=UPI002980DDAB|nr:iron ABC transporter permease [Sedimentibacter sp.]MDW5299951.1 iron ABC transporter permease [Sedimentibacter sp.]
MDTKIIKKYIFQALFYFMVIFVFILPILRLVEMSFKTESVFTLENYAYLLNEARTINAIKNTVIIAVCSTMFSVLMGCFFSFIVAYTDVKRKKMMEVLVLAPYVIPSYIITLSWSSLLSKKGIINQMLLSIGLGAVDIYTMTGIIFVLGICNTPIVYLITVNMLRKIPRDLEWASLVSGYSIWETMGKINLVQAMPAIIGGGMLSFLAAIDNFSVPAFLGISSGIPVLSTYIYEKAISFGPDSFGLAAALSVMLSIIAIIGTAVQGKFIKKSSNMESIKEDCSIRIELGNKRKYVEWISLAFLTCINIIPLITMIASSFLPNFGKFALDRISFENYKFVFTNSGVKHAIINSFTLAVITCIICIVIGTAIAYIKVRKNAKSIRILEAGASLTYAVPGIVLALAMIFHWTAIPNVYGTIKILLIAYVTRYLILQIKGSTTAVIAVEPSLEEAAMVCGSSKIRTWWKIMIPLLTKQVLSSTFLIFISSLTELTLSSMLAAAGTKTIGLTIFSLQQAGNNNLSAAMSSLIVGMVVILFVVSTYFKENYHTKKQRMSQQKKSIIGKLIYDNNN